MPVRIGGRDPRFRNIGGRDIERMFQLIVSLQILFGSRRGGPILVVLLVVAVLVAGGWFLLNKVNSPNRKLERAHADWDSGVTTRQIDAIKQYRNLLQMNDPIETGMRWLRQDRDKLYRRIIQHEILYEKNERRAREWVIDAIDEGIQDLRFADGEVKDFWDRTVRSLSSKGRSRRSGNSGDEQSHDNPSVLLDGLLELERRP